jgi:hypothetical protein
MKVADIPLVLRFPRHDSLTPGMQDDLQILTRLPLRNWRRWNHPISGDTLRSGNCHHAATAIMVDLVAASAARGWRIGSGFIHVAELSAPVLHSWVESPHGAVVDASQVYEIGWARAAPRPLWFRENAVEPLIQRGPGQVAAAVRRLGVATAALLPLSQVLEAAVSALL